MKYWSGLGSFSKKWFLFQYTCVSLKIFGFGLCWSKKISVSFGGWGRKRWPKQNGEKTGQINTAHINISIYNFNHLFFSFLSIPSDLAQPLSFDSWNAVTVPFSSPASCLAPSSKEADPVAGMAFLKWNLSITALLKAIQWLCTAKPVFLTWLTGSIPAPGPPTLCHPTLLPLTASIPNHLQFPDDPCSPSSLHVWICNFLCLECSPSAPYPKTSRLMGTYSKQPSLDSSFPRPG